MMIREVIAGRGQWHVEKGNCLGVLGKMQDESVDAIVTDPPYSSGGLHAVDRAALPSKKYMQSGTKVQRPEFEGDSRDQRSFGFWCTLWLSECYRVAKPGAPVCVFADWRQVSIATDVLQAAGFTFRGIVPWDKTPAVRPQRGRFRNQAEYIVWGSKGRMPADRAVPVLPGVISEAVRSREKRHMTGKPVELMRQVVRICEPGGVVLDPFCGSGTTGIACQLEGLRFVGIELTDSYARVAREWLGSELAAAA
jgi:site-specific DNA-methyltransferase (adenine-specific)